MAGAGRVKVTGEVKVTLSNALRKTMGPIERMLATYWSESLMALRTAGDTVSCCNAKGEGMRGRSR